jgi:hypothetical protein
MERRLPETVITGSRAWSAFGFALTFPPAAIALWAGIDSVLSGRGLPGGLVLAAAGAFMLVYSVDSLVRTLKPNRFRLDDKGFSLETWRRTSRWDWRRYRGLGGIGHQLMRVQSDDGRIDAVPIGSWPQDLELHLYAYASAQKVEVTKPAGLRRSAAPLMLLSGLLIALALLTGWLSV